VTSLTEELARKIVRLDEALVDAVLTGDVRAVPWLVEQREEAAQTRWDVLRQVWGDGVPLKPEDTVA